MRNALLLTATLALTASPVLAAPVGFWTDRALEQQQSRLWPKMSEDEIVAQVTNIPDRIGSRGLTQEAKALLLAPVAPAAAKDEDAQSGAMLTAARLQKLLSMGGLAEAKRLADSIDLDEEPEPIVMDQVLMALIAMGGKEAACLDLLAYKSETPDRYEALSDSLKGMTPICTYNGTGDTPPDWPGMPHLSRAAVGKTTFTLRDLKDMSDMEAALLTNHANAALIDSYGDDDDALTDDVRALSPFKQALVLWSPNATSSLQWKLIPYGLRHDFISADRAAALYKKGPPLGDQNIPVATAKAEAKDKPAYARLPIYYKTLKSYKTDPAPVSDLVTDILASGTTHSLYGLLPFTEYFDGIDLKTLTKRSAFTAALTLALDGKNAYGNAGTAEPDESPWILGVLLRDQAFDEAGLEVWHTENFETLAALNPGLEDRVSLLLRSIAPDSGKESGVISLYENKKDLTENQNYVMHDGLALSKAEDSVKDSAVGPALVALTQANGNISPDRLDPKGMEAMNRMLNEIGLTHVAKTLAMESLVFRMKSVAAIGETKN